MGFVPMQGWFSLQTSSNVTHHINRTGGGNHMAISINLEKAFDKIQVPSSEKTLSRLEIERNVPQHNQGPICQTHSSHHTQGWQTESFSLQIRTSQGCLLLLLLLNIALGVQARAIWQKKEMKSSKLQSYLFADDTILYGENFRDHPTPMHKVKVIR